MAKRERFYGKPIYPNKMYPDAVLKALDTGSWFMEHGKLIDPLTYVNWYGQSWLLEGGGPKLKHPDDVIREAENKDLTDAQRVRLEAFKERVRRYRALDYDDIIRKAILVNRYPDGFNHDWDGEE